jgi:hypothetical protein
MILKFLGTFVAMAVLDYAWACYTLSVQRRRPGLAGALAGAIVLLNAIVVLSYFDNHWMLVAAACGAFAGTFLSVREK